MINSSRCDEIDSLCIESLLGKFSFCSSVHSLSSRQHTFNADFINNFFLLGFHFILCQCPPPNCCFGASSTQIILFLFTATSGPLMDWSMACGPDPYISLHRYAHTEKKTAWLNVQKSWGRKGGLANQFSLSEERIVKGLRAVLRVGFGHPSFKGLCIVVSTIHRCRYMNLRAPGPWARGLFEMVNGLYFVARLPVN